MEENTKQEAEDALASRVIALSPRRLITLTGLFVVALAIILGAKFSEDASSRRIETELRLQQSASDGAIAMNLAIMTGASVRDILISITPKKSLTAVYHLSATGDVISAIGAREATTISSSSMRALTLNVRGAVRLDEAGGEIAAAWRPLDNGEVILVAAPARDMYDRTPVWLSYFLLLGSVTLVVASLMGAFIRQSKAAGEAAGALVALRDFNEALAGGRTSPWFYDGRERTLLMTRSFLEPLGLGARDRRFTLREITALVHADDLRTALGIFTGDTSGVTEGAIRLREPRGGWSRVYVRTSPNATRFQRSGVAIDLSGAKSLTPGAAIAESRLRDAIETIPEAFVLWDARGRLAVFNRRFSSIFRIAPKDLRPGLSPQEVAQRAKAGSEILSNYFAPDSAIDQESLEVALPGGRWVHISRRRTSEGGLVCVASNVTDLKRRAKAQKVKERELQRSVLELEGSRKELSGAVRDYQIEKHRAEEASRSKSEFLANMSHELRTPLNAINGFSEVMRAELYGPLGDNKYKEYVDDIHASGQHLLELIDDILDMSKIEAGRLQLEPKRIELERILHESIRLVSRRAAETGVKLTVSIGHAPPVWADARAAKQVALNLLANAIKFTPEGGAVTLTAESDLDGVTVIVADNGHGIKKDQLKKLGAPFELGQDHFSKSRNGSGLGLALSRSLMELQGGLLALASQQGKGTVACATFPRRPDAKVRLPQFIRKDAHILTDGTQAPHVLPVAVSAPEAAE